MEYLPKTSVAVLYFVYGMNYKKLLKDSGVRLWVKHHWKDLKRDFKGTFYDTIGVGWPEDLCFPKHDYSEKALLQGAVCEKSPVG